KSFTARSVDRSDPKCLRVELNTLYVVRRSFKFQCAFEIPSGKQRRLRKAEKRNEHAGNANPFHGAKHYETRGPLSSAISFKVLSSHFHQSKLSTPTLRLLVEKGGIHVSMAGGDPNSFSIGHGIGFAFVIRWHGTGSV